MDKATLGMNRVLLQQHRQIRSRAALLAEITLYSVLARQHLEYCVQFCSPQFKREMVRLERAQRKAAKMITEMEHLLYEELGLFSLERGMLREDLITVFQYLHGDYKEDRGCLVTGNHMEKARSNRCSTQ